MTRARERTANWRPLLLLFDIDGTLLQGVAPLVDAEDRARLPAIARRRAGSGRAPHPRRNTIVIGDTPQDIRCARADGLRCVAVASGPFRSDALTGADLVARDAAELRLALRELGVGTLSKPNASLRVSCRRPGG